MISAAQHDALLELAVDLNRTADVFAADGSRWAADAARDLRGQAEGVRLALHHLTRQTKTASR